MFESDEVQEKEGRVNMIGGLSSKGLEKEFRFWSKLGVDFIMLGVAYDFFFDDRRVEKVVELKNKHGLNILIHPKPDGRTLLSPANPDAHKTIFESLKTIKKLVREEELINKIISHLPSYDIPGRGYKTFTEEEAIKNSMPFYRKLKKFSGPDLVLENTYSPDIEWELGWKELGYTLEHFKLFDFRKDWEFCFDTGHFNLSNMSIEDIEKIPLKLTCLHLHSNNGRIDQHMPLTKRNFNHWRSLEKMLSNDKYMILEVKNKKQEIPYTLPYLRQNKIPP